MDGKKDSGKSRGSGGDENEEGKEEEEEDEKEREESEKDERKVQSNKDEVNVLSDLLISSFMFHLCDNVGFIRMSGIKINQKELI